MATLWKFYPPHPALASATLTATTGTSSTLASSVDNRKLSLMNVDTVGTYVSGADEFMYKIDFGSTKACDFIAIVNHSLYTTETAQLRVYVDNLDNSGLTNPITPLGAQSAAAGDEPIWFEAFTASYTKRYFWPLLDSIAATAYAGLIIIGAKVEPTNDPNWESDIEIDIESGRIVNKGPGGYNWKTRTHGVKRGWQVHYEFLNDADRAILENWLSDSDYADTPFVFTKDGGTVFYYGELIGNPVIKEMQSGLHNIDFTISEVIG